MFADLFDRFFFSLIENTERACKEFGAIHCVFPAGNAVVAATEVEEIVDAQWRDLGMPETLWHCRGSHFRNKINRFCKIKRYRSTLSFSVCLDIFFICPWPNRSFGLYFMVYFYMAVNLV